MTDTVSNIHQQYAQIVQAKTRLFADDSVIYRDVSTTERWSGPRTMVNQMGNVIQHLKVQHHHITWKKHPLTHTYYLRGMKLEEVDTVIYFTINITNGTSHLEQYQRESML